MIGCICNTEINCLRVYLCLSEDLRSS